MNKLVYKGDLELYYYSKDPQFALVKSMGGGKITTIGGWTSCRETLINNVARHAFNTNKKNRINRAKFEVMVCFMTTNRKGNVIGQKTAIRRYIRRSEKLINHFEKLVNWPLTKIRPVASPQKKTAIVFMLYASPRWMRNSFLISTFLLMFRAGRSPQVTKWKDHKDLLDKLKTYPGGKDGNAIRRTSNRWEVLLKHRDKLNGDRRVADNFEVKKVCKGHTYAIGVEGISKLCAGSTADWVYLNRFANVCKKEGLRTTLPQGKIMSAKDGV